MVRFKYAIWKNFCTAIINKTIMAEERFEIVLDGVPYGIVATPFEFNEETRYKVQYNGNEHIFTWDSRLKRLAPIDDDAGTFPDNLEEAIAHRIESSTKI
jgi:hypothetical protein